MTRPLYKDAVRHPAERLPKGHAGLWYDKFCNRWQVEGETWSMASARDGTGGGKKLEWINTLTNGEVGVRDELDEYASRLARLVERRKGRYGVFVAESRFVTGLGRSHPVENGFAWHSTLGTPYLPGTSIKGMVRAWASLGAAPPAPREAVQRLFGGPESGGRVSFLDAVPVAPVQLEPDVVTPHYAGWREAEPPGDWRSPKPIPFLVTAAKTPFLFGVMPRADTADADLDEVMSWLCLALTWSGSGAKTAVGYGRFRRESARTDELRQRFRAREREHEARIRAQRAAVEREARRAAMHPVDREIEEILEGRSNQNEPEITTIFRMAEGGHWSGSDKTRAAEWLERSMRSSKQWRETSGRKNPAKDKAYQRTLQVRRWLKGE